MFAAALVIITALTTLWAGPAASAGVSLAQSRASQSATPARVKYYIVPAVTNGAAESLSAIAEKTLGDAGRFMEIFDLNKGRPQPHGGRLETPRVIQPGWVLQLPADASGPGVHLGSLPLASPRPSSSASHRPSPPARPAAGGAPAPHSPISWAGIGIALVGALGLAGLAVGLIRRRRAGGAVRRGPSHARQPGLPASGRAGGAERRARDTQLAESPWSAADHPNGPEAGPRWTADHPSMPGSDPPWPAADYPSMPGSDPPWPAGGPHWTADHPSMPGSAPLWPGGGQRWTADHPSMPGSDPLWPAVGPPWPAADQLSRRPGPNPGSPAGGPRQPAAHPSWPAADPSWPRTGGRAAAPRRGSPPELHHDRRSRAASVSGISLTHHPVGNWGPSGGLAASPADRTQWRSAQFAPAAATQMQYEAAPADRDQVVLTKAPPARPDRERAWDAPGGMLQLAAENAAGLASPGALQTAERPNADSVRIAGRILSVADDQAAEIMQQASERAAEITQHASGQAAAIREAAEREAAEITRQASGQAAAIRAAAEEEAAELRASLRTMSAELSRAATYVTDNLAAPPKPATRPEASAAAGSATPSVAEPHTKPTAKPASRPQREATESLTRPATRPGVSPRRTPSARPATKTKGRQAGAWRKMAVSLAVLFLVGVTGAATEIGLHGFSFFLFRNTGTGAGNSQDLNENQGPGQPDAHHKSHVSKPSSKPGSKPGKKASDKGGKSK